MFLSTKSSLRILILILSLALITACGGGGSAPTPLLSFLSNILSVEVGQSFNVSWTSTNANSCNASGAWSGTKSTTGNETITINAPGDNTFTLSCTGKGGSVAKSLTIEGYRLLDGVAVDGYISSAEIFIDENDNYTQDGEEEGTTTDNNGKFTDLKYANGSLISLGGTDLDSQTLLDNFLILQKLTGHTEFKVITPVTSLAAFMSNASNVNAALGIDSTIDVFTFDPVANKGDGGVYDYLYEKGNQLTILAFALQNITNDLNTTTETTEDYFKSIAEELETEYTETSTKIDIETNTFITKVINNIEIAKSLNLDETFKTNIIDVLSAVLPVIEVKSTDDLTTGVIRFAVSTLQTDIKAIANGTATSNTLDSYKSDLLNYIATDQDIDADKIAPTITAIADSAITAEDTLVEISVLANDSYLSSAPITLNAGNGSSGITTMSNNIVSYTPYLDYNGSDNLTYTITQGDKTSTASVVITVTPVNDAPSIDVASTILVAENQTAVTTISTSDVDGDNLTLTLGGTNADSFNLSTDNVLTFKEAPDYEIKTSYQITLTLTDGTETVTKDLTITITNVNEYSPVISSAATFSAAENQTSIGTATATDADGDSLTYSLSGTDASSLSISSSGVLTFNSAPNYEAKTSYSVTVNVSDGTNTSSQSVTITIINVNEFSPVINVNYTDDWVQRGADIDGEAQGDGNRVVSISSDGNTVAIGAYGNDGNGTDSGHVRVFDWNGSAWAQRGEDIDG
ncbi:Ig-like domain-containing protein, partial [Gammaproteobacteria bacterium]|nr:Ig-like domain-containing protein [Gammaproteobacteria bacterium]